MNVRELFNSNVSQYGGIPRECLKSPLIRRAYDDIIKIFSISDSVLVSSLTPSMKRAKRLYINLVENYKANAFADKINNLYIIGIWHGLLIGIFDLFFSLLSSKEIFPEIGNIESERNNLKLPKDSFLNYERLFNNIKIQKGGKVFIANYIPKDDLRKCFARDLAYGAIAFVLMHEINHIMRGHIDYLDENGQESGIFEFREELFGVSGYDVHKILELDADIHSFLGISEWLKTKGCKSSFDVFFKKDENIIRVATFIIGIVFFLLEEFNIKRSLEFDALHPNSRMRTRIALNWLIMRWGDDKVFPKAALEKGRLLGLNDLVSAADIIGLKQTPFHYEQTEELDIEKEIDLLSELWPRYQEIEPELKVEEFDA
jgi:hypothetical protein